MHKYVHIIIRQSSVGVFFKKTNLWSAQPPKNIQLHAQNTQYVNTTQIVRAYTVRTGVTGKKPLQENNTEAVGVFSYEKNTPQPRKLKTLILGN